MAQVVRARLELAQDRVDAATQRLDHACALLGAREPVRPNDRADCESTRARIGAR